MAAALEQSTCEVPTRRAFKEIQDYPPVMLIGDVKEFTRLGTVRAYELLKHPKCPTIHYGRKAVYRDDFLKFYLGFIDSEDVDRG